ncbi:uncharacterized protein K452DRAFT_228059 [Aplosporella prunicola CBS 121167]|uniref:Sulfotransferase domain-containing protein n=1 Tax=Aplosporella prunicola CBS 121167 TaxID=1176127 RepID=A0A6A6BBQ9_9PEZI|nr:uncharacterized protein K452DRAFT_228059 [Aplosporella prunicola CBS 121167]KAF2141672.1 hypothetical protein K452DRAFT_228059 [Aplosporella prunicola CBS 121167]
MFNGNNPETWVSRRGAKRTVPMEVIVVGMPRTGTLSMVTAFEKLGYEGVYHMISCFENPYDCDMWREAADAKWFGKGKPYGREEWDQLLGHCKVVTDFPPAAFADDLIAAYPEAKVVLTLRDEDAWFKSVDATIGAQMRSWPLWMLSKVEPEFLGRFMGMAPRLWEGFFGGPAYPEEKTNKAGFRRQNELIRSLVPADRLLEYRVGEGWERLCEFLEKPVPEEPFPRVNDTQNMHVARRRMLTDAAAKVVSRAAKISVPLMVVGVALFFARKRVV